MSPGRRSQGTSTALLERLLLVNFTSPAGLTRAQLEESTGLSRTVVAGVVAALVERGELVEMPQSPAPGVRGRPPVRYQRPSLLAPVLLIQLVKDGSTGASLVFADNTSGEAVDCAPWWQDWATWSRSVVGIAQRLAERAPLPPRVAVVSMPFPVAEGHGAPPLYYVPRSVLTMAGQRMPPHVPWLDRDPRTKLSYLLGCPALPVNDANLAALGEARFGAGRGYRTVVHVSVLNGIGAGLVLDGRLFTGAHGFAGELAHVQITRDGYPCVCGNRGCLCTEASTLSRLGIVKGALPAPPAPPAPQPAASQGCHPAAAGPHRLTLAEYLTGTGKLIGRALAPLMTAVDPDCLVVDARLGAYMKYVVPAVRGELERGCPPPVAEGLAVLAGELRGAERFGALALADAHATALLATG